MNSIVPYFEAGSSWDDNQVQEAFFANKNPKKVQLMGLVAERSAKNPALLNLLKSEAIAPENQGKIFFGFIKFSWIPVLAVLEYGSANAKENLSQWIQYWSEEEQANFLDYISKETEFLSWFSQLA